MRLFALLLVAPLATALAAGAPGPASGAGPTAAPAAACPPQPQPQRLPRFPAGEALDFKLDALGADLGTFDVSSEAPAPGDRPRVALVLKSRAKTSAFVSTNVSRYEAFATATLGPGLAPLRYREDVDEGADHKSQEIDFPPANGRLALHATKNGNPEPLELAAGPAVRDMLSTLYLLRGQATKVGQPICVDVLAGRKVWRLSGQVAARESIDTPLGRFATLRIDAVATREDDQVTKRSAHVWVSDDARRLPLVAIGEVKGRTLRAQLVRASSAGGKSVAEERPNHQRVGAAIGR